MPTQIACDTLCNDRCKVQLAARHTCTAHRHIGIHQFACLYSDISPADHNPPQPECCQIVNLPLIPSLLNLIRQFLINQQGFDVDFAAHASTVPVITGTHRAM